MQRVIESDTTEDITGGLDGNTVFADGRVKSVTEVNKDGATEDGLDDNAVFADGKVK